MASEFEKYAVKHLGMSSARLDSYARVYSGYMNPTIIEERQLNVASMDVFSRLMMDRIIFLGVGIDNDVANIVQAQLLFLESTDSSADIQIYINSPGGMVYAGLGIYDTMQLVSPDVATICTGMAASMAAVLLAAGAGGKRSVLPHSRVLIHQPMGGELKGELYDILSKHTGQTVQKITKDADRDYWMTAPEAVKYGMVDNILSRPSRQ